MRERFETNNSVNFGVGENTPPQNYLLSRLETHADLRIANQFQGFVQIQSDFAPGKAIITPVDEDRLSMEQAFIAIVEPVPGGTFKFRLGRQQFAFDLQRFISVRDGPNVRQSYDAIWGDYELNRWRFITFYSQPVQNRNIRAFDDFSSSALTYGGFRVERKLGDSTKLSSYLSHFKQNDVTYPSVSGNESRNILDVRIVNTTAPFDGDFEFMGQVGSIANENIRAWGHGFSVRLYI